MNSSFNEAYEDLIVRILHQGDRRQSRNADTIGIFGQAISFNDLESGCMPIPRGRKYYAKGVIGEFAAFLKGPKNVEDFEKFGCNYWKQWADETGILNLDYGNAWRNFNGFDQMAALQKSLKDDPFSRRHLVTGWNPPNLENLSLPCCHFAYQFYVREWHGIRYLDMKWDQRSVDTMLGLPADAIMASLWVVLLANELNYQPGRITMTFGDTHIYAAHEESARQYLRACGNSIQNAWNYGRFELCTSATVDNFTPELIQIVTTTAKPPISFELIK